MTTPPPGFGPPPSETDYFGEDSPIAAPRREWANTQRTLIAAMVAFAVLIIAGVAYWVFGGIDGVQFAEVGNSYGRGPVVTMEPLQTALPSTRGPVAKPVTYRGSGSTTLSIRKPSAGPALLYVKGNAAKKTFIVTSQSASGAPSGLLVTAVYVPYEGVRLLDTTRLGETTSLRIDATGPWTVQIRDVRTAPAFSTSARGSTDAVYRYTGRAGTAAIASAGRPATMFTVRTFDAAFIPSVVATSVGAYDASNPWPAGPMYVEVHGNARPWSITVR